MYQFIFHPDVNTDFVDSFIWYEKHQAGLGERFRQAVNETLTRIQDKPELFPVVKSGFRETTIPVFPYSIVYKFNKRKNLITIAAIYHAKRNPSKKFRT
jgi:toxin ParE1/3/4